MKKTYIHPSSLWEYITPLTVLCGSPSPDPSTGGGEDPWNGAHAPHRTYPF